LKKCHTNKKHLIISTGGELPPNSLESKKPEEGLF